MSSTLRVEDVYITPEEFLAAERVSETRHEYVAGVVYAMAGGSLHHSLIATNIGGELRNRLKGSECNVFGSGAMTRVLRDAATYLYYADVAVDCTALSPHFVEQPTAIFEVLSPSTDRNDRGDKKLNYQSLASLRVYALVEQHRPTVTLYRRDGDAWKMEFYSDLEEVIALGEIGCELPVAEIYRGIF
jgi:Uma2 family endonuclease